MKKKPPDPGGHPIQVVVRRAGVSADVLRAWEKRYGAVTPVRSATGRRLYTEADIERLRLIKQAMAGGRRIGDVATLATAELERLVQEDREEAVRLPPEPQRASPVDAMLAEAMAAMRRPDQDWLRGVLSRALLVLGPTRFIEDIARPFMHGLGAMWERGEVSPGHEHAATEVMRQLLSEVLRMLQPSNGAPLLVTATPTGQRHEIGALLATTVAALEGWRVAYLGADLPAADIARVALDTQASAVALSITAADPALTLELAELRRIMGRDMPIFVGGQRAATLNGASSHVITLDDLESFRAALQPLGRA